MLLVSLYALFWPDPAGGDSRLPGADKAVHALLFGALAATARLRFGGRWRVLAVVVTYAVVSEAVQASVLARRSGDPFDLVADLVGAALGWWLVGRSGQTGPDT